MVETSPTFIGREKELKKMDAHFQNALQGHGSVVFIAGEAGIGKTELINEFLGNHVLKYMFSLKLDYKRYMEEGKVHKDLRQALKDQKRLLSPKARIHEIDKNSWSIKDGSKRYSVEFTGSKLNIFIPKTEEEVLITKTYCPNIVSKETEKETGEDISFYPFRDIFHEIFVYRENKKVREGAHDEIINIAIHFTKLCPGTDKIYEGVLISKKIFGLIQTKMGKKEKEEMRGRKDPKNKTFRAEYIRALQSASEVYPLVLVIENLRFIDDSSYGLLSDLSEVIKDSRILIIGTYRPEEIKKYRDGEPNPMRDVDGMTNFKKIKLGFLKPEDVSAYISKVCPNHVFPRDFIDFIYNKSDGNSLFVVELIKLLKEDEVIIQEREQWVLKKKIQNIDIPIGIIGVIKRRIDNINNEIDLQLHQCASIEGERFTPEVLSELLLMNGIKLFKEEKKLTTKIRKVRGLYELIKLAEEKEILEKDTYQFIHSLIHNEIYKSLLPGECKDQHKKIAKIWENKYKNGEGGIDISTLAWHFEQGKSFDKARKYYKEAADAAEQSNSFVEAQSLYKKAYKIMDKKDIGTVEEKVEILDKMATISQILGRGEDAKEKLEECLKLNKEVGDNLFKASILTTLGITSFYLGEFKKSLDALEEAKKIYENHDFYKLPEKYQKSYGICINWLGINYRNYKNLEKSQEFHTKAEEIAEKIKYPTLLAHAKANLGAVELWKKNFEEVIKYWEESKAISEEADDTPWIAHYTIDVGYMYFLNRKYKEAEEKLDEGIEIARDNYFEENVARGIMNKGSLYFAQGKMDKAMKEYKDAFEIAKKEKISKLMWRIQHNMGNIHRKDKDYKKAYKYYLSSVEHVKEMLSNVEPDKKEGFLGHRLDPFRSLILLSRERNNEDEALKYAKTLGFDLLTDYYEKLKQGIDLKKEETEKGNLNFFDGYYVVTE